MNAIWRKPEKNKIELMKREDGRWQVSLGGYVRWCGYSEETAQLWYAALTAPPADHTGTERALNRAIRA